MTLRERLKSLAQDEKATFLFEIVLVIQYIRDNPKAMLSGFGKHVALDARMGGDYSEALFDLPLEKFEELRKAAINY